MSAILTLRVTAEQRKRWQEAAKQEGLPLSGWMRKRCDACYRKRKNDKLEPDKSAAERVAELLYVEQDFH